jgi:hypothetical protein
MASATFFPDTVYVPASTDWLIRSIRFKPVKIVQQSSSLVVHLSQVRQCQCPKGLSLPLDIVCQRITLRLFTA